VIFEYEFVEHLGRGAHSDVFLVLHQETGDYFAAKVYGKRSLRRCSIGNPVLPVERLTREIAIMEAVDHPNCMPLIEILDDEETDSLILIIPFADDGALSPHSWRSDRIPEATAQVQFAQIARAIDHIHSLGIVHRDLKPDNILKFTTGRVVLADFSVSLQLDDPDVPLEATDGTPAYYAPELCNGDPYLAKPADVWAFGMMLYVVIYGRCPFIDVDDDEDLCFAHFITIMDKIVTTEYRYPDPISPELLDLFQHVLDKDPSTRYTMRQVLDHPWLRDVPNPFPKEAKD
jgi:serine/threonine protein kinase